MWPVKLIVSTFAKSLTSNQQMYILLFWIHMEPHSTPAQLGIAGNLTTEITNTFLKNIVIKLLNKVSRGVYLSKIGKN